MIGTTVSHYRILERLGGGGMGEVYKALDLRLGRPVAMKFLSSELTSEPDAKTRFVHEARAASALQQNNICVVHDIDENDDGRIFITMEFLEGDTLREKIAHGPLTIEEAVDIALQVVRGLSSAHDHGIVHRDIKPANLMVTNAGVVKIVDFGLAKLSGPTRITRQGTTLGTAAYMSPEQASGEPVDQRADIWSLGVVLYEMLTGRRPFEADYENALIYAIINAEPDPVTALRTGIPIALDQIVRKCLEKSSSERYQHAAELGVDLGKVRRILSEGRRADGVSPSPRKKKRGLVPGFAIVASTILAALGWWLLGDRTHDREGGTGRNSIAVLPFPAISPGDDARMFADGINGEILNRLTKIKALSVKAQTSVMQYRDTKKRVREIGSELGVDFVIEGSVQQAGDRVRVQVQVIDARSEDHLWGETYDRDLADIFAIESEVAQRIAESLDAALTSREIALVERRPTQNLQAYSSYLQGNYWWHTGLTIEENEKALAMYEEAAALDTTFALAFAATARVQVALMGYEGKRSPARVELARRALERAVVLAPDLPETHLAQAAYYSDVESDFTKGRREYELALSDAPGNTELLTHFALGLIGNGDVTEGHRVLRRAYDLDNYWYVSAWLTCASFYHRDFAQARHWNEVTVLRDPRQVYWSHEIPLHGYGDTAAYREVCLKTPVDPGERPRSWRYYPPWQFILALYARDYPAALQLAGEATRLNWPLGGVTSDVSTALLHHIMSEKNGAVGSASEAVARYKRLSGEMPSIAGHRLRLAVALALAGKRDEALRVVSEIKGNRSLWPMVTRADFGDAFALTYLVLGEEDLALTALEHLMAVPSSMTQARLRLDPVYDPLRKNPRFQALLSMDQKIPLD